MRAVLAVVSIALVACKKDPAPPPPDPSPVPSAIVSASSTSSAVATAVADAASGAAGGDEGAGASAITSSAPVKKAPPHHIDLDEMKATPPIPNAERVIASGKGHFLQCYKHGLDGDPSMAGDVRISVKVGADGIPTSSDVTQNLGNVSAPVASCAAQRARRLVFAHPQGEAPSTLTFRIRMVLEGK